MKASRDLGLMDFLIVENVSTASHVWNTREYAVRNTLFFLTKLPHLYCPQLGKSGGVFFYSAHTIHFRGSSERYYIARSLF